MVTFPVVYMCVAGFSRGSQFRYRTPLLSKFELG